MNKYLLFLPMLLFSCSAEKEKTDLSEQLIGEWRNVCMKVDMYSYNNTDSVKTMEVSEENWEKVMKIHTIQTFYKADRTYNSAHTNLLDSIVYNPAGNWFINGDTLVMNDTFPVKGPSYRYKFAIKENLSSKETIAEFWGVEDFDQDGKKDDRYYGKQRKQK